jgi:hypothetical protein
MDEPSFGEGSAVRRASCGKCAQMCATQINSNFNQLSNGWPNRSLRASRGTLALFYESGVDES